MNTSDVNDEFASTNSSLLDMEHPGSTIQPSSANSTIAFYKNIFLEKNFDALEIYQYIRNEVLKKYIAAEYGPDSYNGLLSSYEHIVHLSFYSPMHREKILRMLSADSSYFINFPDLLRSEIANYVEQNPEKESLAEECMNGILSLLYYDIIKFEEGERNFDRGDRDININFAVHMASILEGDIKYSSNPDHSFDTNYLKKVGKFISALDHVKKYFPNDVEKIDNYADQIHRHAINHFSVLSNSIELHNGDISSYTPPPYLNWLENSIEVINHISNATEQELENVFGAKSLESIKLTIEEMTPMYANFTEGGELLVESLKESHSKRASQTQMNISFHRELFTSSNFNALQIYGHYSKQLTAVLLNRLPSHPVDVSNQFRGSLLSFVMRDNSYFLKTFKKIMRSEINRYIAQHPEKEDTATRCMQGILDLLCYDIVRFHVDYGNQIEKSAIMLNILEDKESIADYNRYLHDPKLIRISKMQEMISSLDNVARYLPEEVEKIESYKKKLHDSAKDDSRMLNIEWPLAQSTSTIPAENHSTTYTAAPSVSTHDELSANSSVIRRKRSASMPHGEVVSGNGASMRTGFINDIFAKAKGLIDVILSRAPANITREEEIVQPQSYAVTGKQLELNATIPLLTLIILKLTGGKLPTLRQDSELSHDESALLKSRICSDLLEATKTHCLNSGIHVKFINHVEIGEMSQKIFINNLNNSSDTKSVLISNNLLSGWNGSNAQKQKFTEKMSDSIHEIALRNSAPYKNLAQISPERRDNVTNNRAQFANESSGPRFLLNNSNAENRHHLLSRA